MVLVFAHRGHSAKKAENSLHAFTDAVKLGFDGIECDVRITKDNVPVILHDASLVRTTTEKRVLADLKFADLRTLIPEWNVPSVEAAVELTEELGFEGIWNFEIKDYAAVDYLVPVLREYLPAKRVLISSMDPRALQLAHDIAPEYERALIVVGPLDEEDIEVALESECAAICPEVTYLTQKQVKSLQKQGLRVATWTINDEKLATKLAEWGVEGIITDRVEVLLAMQALRPSA